jgi:hypothetical protein
MEEVEDSDAQDQHDAARLRVGELHRPLEPLRRPVEEVQLRADVVDGRRLRPDRRERLELRLDVVGSVDRVHGRRS